MAPCCSCNGCNAVCKRCACVHAGRPCTSCLPLKMHRCGNVLVSRMMSEPASNKMCVNQSCSPAAILHVTRAAVVSHDVASGPAVCVSSQSTSLQLQSSNLPRYDHCSSESVVDATSPSLLSHIDELFIKAYGASLVHSDGGSDSFL